VIGRTAPAFVLLFACGGDSTRVPGDPDGGSSDADSDVDADSDSDTGPAVDPSDEVYAADLFPRFELTLSDESIAALEADPRTYVTATFTYGDEVIDEIGVHLKGEYTFRDLSAKAAFKIKFDEFVADQEFRGLRRMTWNNMFEDPSFVAERLVYQAFREADLPAPRCNSAEVWVNGEMFGVYANVETEDKTFLARWFDSNDGNLYEETGAEFTPGNEWAFELETNETANDRSDLTAFIAAIDAASDETFMQDVADVLDVDRFLEYSAMEGVVNQWDGYSYTRFGPNNFRFYIDPTTGLGSFLPWGMDMAMKPFPSSGEAHLPMRWPTGLILQRCFDSPSCRTAYDDAARAAADLYDSLDLEADAQDAYDQIQGAVYADPRREHDEGTFEGFFGWVRDFARDRAAVVRADFP